MAKYAYSSYPEVYCPKNKSSSLEDWSWEYIFVIFNTVHIHTCLHVEDERPLSPFILKCLVIYFLSVKFSIE